MDGGDTVFVRYNLCVCVCVQRTANANFNSSKTVKDTSNLACLFLTDKVTKISLAFKKITWRRHAVTQAPCSLSRTDHKMLG